jgi:DNA-binding XRE family transcriptional regulator
MPSRNRGKTWKTYRSGGRKNGVPWCYRHLWDKLRREGVVSSYMTAEERKEQDRARDKAIVESWTAARIKQFADSLPWSRTRLAAMLAINRRSLRGLESGEYTPGAALCHRMAMIEQQVAAGEFHAVEITPARAELRRRLLLFRAWWYQKPPSKESPRVTVRVSVEWGKGRA